MQFHPGSISLFILTLIFATSSVTSVEQTDQSHGKTCTLKSKEDDSTHFLQVTATNIQDVESDAPPTARNIDHTVETVEIEDPNAEEKQTEEDEDEDEEECIPEDNAPLCDDCIVARACARLNDEGQTRDVVGWPQILHALSAQQEAIDKFKDAMGLEGEFIKCSDLCRSLVSIAEQNNKTLPNASDWGCYEVGAITFCDVDLDPGRLGAFMGSSKTTVAYDDKHTPHSEINGENTSLLSYRKITTESVHPPQQTSVLQQNSPKDEEHNDAYGDTLKKGIPYSTLSFVLRMMNEFRIYVSTGKLRISSGQSSLIEADTERNQEATGILAVQAKGWVSAGLNELGAYKTEAKRTEWFWTRRRRRRRYNCPYFPAPFRACSMTGDCSCPSPDSRMSFKCGGCTCYGCQRNRRRRMYH